MSNFADTGYSVQDFIRKGKLLFYEMLVRSPELEIMPSLFFAELIGVKQEFKIFHFVSYI